MANPVENANTVPSSSWWSLSYWTGGSNQTVAQPIVSHEAEAGPSTVISSTVVTDVIPSYDLQLDSPKLPFGLDRIYELYQKKTMEVDVSVRVMRMTFFCGFLMGGSSGYAQARQTYEINNVGRKYLSPSDALKRRTDYAILRFAKGGFGMGVKCALISGSIVVLSTHLAAYRQRFSSWYFPALSVLVGGVFAFPLGLTGLVKACGLGITSGLTLSAVSHLYALSIDKTVDEAYWMFKKDYEKDIEETEQFEKQVAELMKSEGIRWRPTAVKMLKKADDEKLSNNDA